VKVRTSLKSECQFVLTAETLSSLTTGRRRWYNFELIPGTDYMYGGVKPVNGVDPFRLPHHQVAQPYNFFSPLLGSVVKTERVPTARLVPLFMEGGITC
jgi:hypothetical protein